MVRGKVVILNEKGLHMRPAGSFCKCALDFPCNVLMKIRDYNVSAKSILGVLSACVKYGEEIEILCDGTEEEEALLALLSLAENKFNEE